MLEYQHSYLRPRTDLPGSRSPDGMPGMLGGDLLSYLRAEPQLTMVAYSPLLDAVRGDRGARRPHEPGMEESVRGDCDADTAPADVL